MRQLDEIRAANCPRPDRNRFLPGGGRCAFQGITDRTARFIEDFQLTDAALWWRFVEQFRTDADVHDAGWRGEYWGKMMRGACFVYDYTRSPALYEILAQTVRDMLDSMDGEGRISTYPRDNEFFGWDIWSRKYVLLGMQYFLEICDDPGLAQEIVRSMCRQVDYLASHIGREEEGKKPITKATNHWRGLNSSSVLEPVVRLYNITGQQRYLDFATYIVEAGGTSVANIFALAYEDKLCPYQYPVTKAYEMTSCFEGLLEYYRVQGTPWHKEAIIRYAKRILESDFTVIGSSGCTHELFDHSTVRQANTTNGKIMQETCVTVTLMKFFYQLTLLTGDAAYADGFERSYYNAYLGAVNTERSIEPTIRELLPQAVVEPLPFDSYSPLTAGTRGNGIGGLKPMADGHYYGCCACIGAAGVGLVPKMALMREPEGLVLNLYLPGTMETTVSSGESVRLNVETEYPREGTVRILVETEKREPFAISLRIPGWSGHTQVLVNGAQCQAGPGYFSIRRNWHSGDEVILRLDMRTEAVRPISYGHEILMNKVIWGENYMVSSYDEENPQAKYHISLRRGPLVLAADSCLGYDAAGTFGIAVNGDGYVEARLPSHDTAPYPHMAELEIPLENGESFRVTDYASAGKLWQGKIAAWIRTGRG